MHEFSISEANEQSIDLQMIKDYPIIAKTLVNYHLWADGKHPLSMYSCETTEDNVMCFGKLH